MNESALVITVSTRAAAGVYEDKSGPIIVDALHDLGFTVAGAVIVPDGDAVGCGAARCGSGRVCGGDHHRRHWTASS